MKRISPAVLILIAFCGCESNPVHWVANRLTATHCEARILKPGTRYRDIDYDNGGGWVEVGGDGKARPIPPPESDGVR